MNWSSHFFFWRKSFWIGSLPLSSKILSHFSILWASTAFPSVWRFSSFRIALAAVSNDGLYKRLRDLFAGPWWRTEADVARRKMRYKEVKPEGRPMIIIINAIVFFFNFCFPFARHFVTPVTSRLEQDSLYNYKYLYFVLRYSASNFMWLNFLCFHRNANAKEARRAPKSEQWCALRSRHKGPLIWGVVSFKSMWPKHRGIINATPYPTFMYSSREELSTRLHPSVFLSLKKNYLLSELCTIIIRVFAQTLKPNLAKTRNLISLSLI